MNTTWQQIRTYFIHMSVAVQIGANFMGAIFTTFYVIVLDIADLSQTGVWDEVIESFVVFILLVLGGLAYYRKWFGDVSAFLRLKIDQQPIPEDFQKRVQRKILNIPFVTSAISMGVWTLSGIFNFLDAVFFNSIESFASVNAETVMHAGNIFSAIFIGGVVTCTTIFFVMEHYCRRYLFHFFPKGQLINVKGVFRLNLRHRIMITFVFASFIPITDMAYLAYCKVKMMLSSNAEPPMILSELSKILTIAVVMELILAWILSYLLSKVIVSPVKEMQTAMERVEQGDWEAKVKVRDTNELGILGNNFNKMTEGLRERYEIKQSLLLAREVQQSLLPKVPPNMAGVDISGKIVFSDETGGDYYDYRKWESDDGIRRVTIVIGDVSEHGIHSAILMASTRAFIRQRSVLPSDTLSQFVNDINYQFSRDVSESGHFMTAFFLTIEPDNNLVRWVRAGHDAAILFDPVTESFQELKGDGLALGINIEYPYEENTLNGFRKGQVIVLGTDGLWEAVDESGEMFGKKRMRVIIRQYAHETADTMVNAILGEVKAFSATQKLEDDITLVVVKRT